MSTSPLEQEQAAVQEVAVNSEEARSLCEKSLDFLASIAMPLVFMFCFPPVLVTVWQWLLSFTHQKRIFPQLALGLPRGFAKTTLIKLYILYCILFTRKKFILVISNTATLAENIISDVVDMLEEPNIKRLFGDWRLGIEKDTQAFKKFGFRGRTIILAGLGAGSSLRGLNLKNQRPDVMIFEDIQSREQADSQILSDNLERWMTGTAMKAKSPHGCVFIFVANMYPTKWSILRKLKSNPTWTKFIAGGILADGTSLWEELHPIAQLYKEFENDLAMGRPEIFYSEVLNDENASSNTLIDLSKLPDPSFDWEEQHVGNFIIIDPATDKANADAVSVGYFEVRNGLPAIVDLVEGRLSPGDTIRAALNFCLTNNCRLVVVEANAYQYTFKYWFDVVTAQLGIYGIECVPIYSGATSKNSRILTMFKSLVAGELFIKDNCFPAVALQISQFNPLRTDNTDGLLDLLTYSPRVLAEFPDQVLLSNVFDAQEYAAMSLSDIEHTCSF